MYLPAEIRDTNTCACDLDMRLDFSHLLQQWVFSCGRYHQGAPKKCARRVLAQEIRYRLTENSLNSLGGVPVPVNVQTVTDEDKKVMDGPLPPVVHLPSLDSPSNLEALMPLEDEGDIFKSLYRSLTLNSAGSKDWVGDNPTDMILAAWEHPKEEWELDRQEQINKLREQYLQLGKRLDDFLYQKIKEDGGRSRQEAQKPAKSNNLSCLGCTEENAMAVFIPCFHVVMCVKCADKSSPALLRLD